MNYVIDIDDTILYSTKTECSKCGRINYSIINEDVKEIELINKLYDEGNIIILHTGRNWDSYILTKNQLLDCGVKYHELVMGKPQGVYVDKDSIKTLSDLNGGTNGIS